MTTKSSKDENNHRRIERMNNWIEHARSLAGKEANDHIRFLFYWIAYEAAYKPYKQNRKVYEHQLRECFHKKVSKCISASKRFQRVLKASKREAIQLIELRQANRKFWYEQDGWDESPQVWETRFKKEVDQNKKSIDLAAYDGRKLVPVLNALFENLNIVRNQIVHGGSSGIHSFGLNQVIWGTKLLKSIIPAFRDCIKQNPLIDWGEPPFPRVGDGPDDPCSPPRFTRDT